MQKIKAILRDLREEISPAEYLLWWAVRICMFVYAMRCLKQAPTPENILLPAVNALGTWAVFLVRVVFPRKSLFGALSFRAQKYITLMVFFGSFVGNFFLLYDIRSPLHYDWLLHAVSGVLMTMLGLHMLSAATRNAPLPPVATACGAMGFSFFLMIAWELVEFIGDFLFGDNNQKYNWLTLQESDPLFPLFSKSAAGMQQLPLLDTMTDLALAFVCTLLTGAVLCALLRRREKEGAMRQVSF